jgi:chemotaxis protein CheD
MIAHATETQPPAGVVLAAGIGQCIISRDPAALLAAYGLGSCIAIAAWDATARIAGLIHILLPEPVPGAQVTSPARFASTGVPHLLRLLAEEGAQRSRLRVVAAGGAQMLSALATVGALKGIGERNATIVTERLRAAGLSLAASDFGGTAGRTLTLRVATGTVCVRASSGPTRDL